MAELRRFYDHGNSLALTIPARWVRALGLKPGDVTLLTLSDGPKITLSLVSEHILTEITCHAKNPTLNNPNYPRGRDQNTRRSDPF